MFGGIIGGAYLDANIVDLVDVVDADTEVVIDIAIVICENFRPMWTRNPVSN